MRVLHVVGSLDLGGGQKLTALVATGLDRTRFDVMVLNLGARGAYDDYLEAHGIPVIDLGLSMKPGLSEIPRTVRGLARLLRVLYARPRWHIVHTHLFRTSLLVAVPARLAGSRLFGTVHRIYFRWQPPFERMLAPLHESIVVDSAAVGRILRARTHIPDGKYVVIHNGIEIAEFESPPSKEDSRANLGLPDDAVVVTEVAHLVPHKGQRYLIASFAQISDPNLRLVIVGDGPERPALEEQAASLGVADRVTFCGVRQDLPLVLAATDILALPSTFEGFGIIQAEAMYMGLPVIATDRGGSTEVVCDGLTGYLVPFGDVNALTDRIQTLVASPALRRRFGAAGRARVLERFTQGAMADRYGDLYDGRLSRGLGGGHDHA